MPQLNSTDKLPLNTNRQTLMYSGKLILILGPSGSGKGTLIKHIKKNHPEYIFPISCTTRDKRPGEKDGEVYYFISKEEFQQRIDNEEFLEWAIVHNDNYYGTLKSEIIAPLTTGKTVLREVDIQGVKSIQELIPKEYLVTIFITTPSWDDLKQRITGRSNISPEELTHRHNSYEQEIQFKDHCNYTIINHQQKLNQAKADLDIILNNL